MRNVLAVEDDALIGMLISHCLADLGFKPILVRTCTEAIDLITAGLAISLAMVDLKLPDGSGGDVIKVLRRHSPQVPIILATGYSELPGDLVGEADERQFVRLDKPWQPEAFQKTVQRLALPSDIRAAPAG